MPVIFFREDQKDPTELEPYASFNKKYDERTEDGLDGIKIKVDIAKHESGFINGFDIDNNYGEDFTLRFSFAKNKQENTELFLVHHTVTFDFDEYFTDFHLDEMAELRKRTTYFYIVGAEYYEFSYNVSSGKTELYFDVLTTESNMRSVCNQLISYDIAIFSRGW